MVEKQINTWKIAERNNINYTGRKEKVLYL